MPDLANDQDALLADFTDWLVNGQTDEGVRSFIDAYRDHLGTRMSDEAADQALRGVFKLMSERPDAWRPLFDRVYSTSGDGFNLQPNALVVEATGGVSAGTAIDVAMGQGRNAVYLASRGWAVTGIDISPVGVSIAHDTAQSMGLELETIVTDHDHYDFGHDRWDLMVFTYTPVRLAAPETVDRIQRALKPGGRLIAESFQRPTQGPARPVDLSPDELAGAYTGFELNRLESVEIVPDWDNSPQRVVRLIAAKQR